MKPFLRQMPWPPISNSVFLGVGRYSRFIESRSIAGKEGKREERSLLPEEGPKRVKIIEN